MSKKDEEQANQRSARAGEGEGAQAQEKGAQRGLELVLDVLSGKGGGGGHALD